MAGSVCRRQRGRRSVHLYIWLQWLSQLPAYLEAHLISQLRDLDYNWRSEICAAVEHRVNGQIPTNRRTEALHKRVRTWEVRASSTGFPLLRARLLLVQGTQEAEANYEQQMAAIQACMTQLRSDSSSDTSP